MVESGLSGRYVPCPKILEMMMEMIVPIETPKLADKIYFFIVLTFL
jgi:hypothetical protein